MSMTLKATFATRREAEMTVERLVQEYAIERTDIFIVSDGDENTAGEQLAGSDIEAGSDSDDAPATSIDRDDAPLHGRINVSVDIEDEALAAQVRSAFGEFDATTVDQG
jgi:hypothetical protein